MANINTGGGGVSDGVSIEALVSGDIRSILGTQLVALWDATSGVTQAASRVSAWASKYHNSGGPYTFSQATAANKPLYEATGGPGSVPQITCDDTARHMPCTAAFASAGSRPTLWMIGRLGGLAGNTRQILGGRASADGAGVYMISSDDGGSGVKVYPNISYSAATLYNPHCSSPAYDTNPHLFSLRHHASLSVADVDGATCVSPASSNDTAPILGCLQIGGSSLGYAAGSITEILITNGDLSAPQVWNIEAYFRAKYATITIV